MQERRRAVIGRRLDHGLVRGKGRGRFVAGPISRLGTKAKT